MEKGSISHLVLVCKKTYSTGYSQAVTHPSTNPAQCCLTSVIRREPVHSAWYGRRTMQHLHRHLLYRHSDHSIWAFGGKQLKTLDCIWHLTHRLRLDGKGGICTNVCICLYVQSCVMKILTPLISDIDLPYLQRQSVHTYIHTFMHELSM